jgi:hypothetical protein
MLPVQSILAKRVSIVSWVNWLAFVLETFLPGGIQSFGESLPPVYFFVSSFSFVSAEGRRRLRSSQTNRPSVLNGPGLVSVDQHRDATEKSTPR